ncbi:MAG: ATP-dependent DNA ligase [Kiritimatiellae bacterium]|nr:ATP-dependent DNA ligase [Kiritimatiellia bacterium]MDW8459550.1 ATP-dependent DNA ligase [Verrucomicrobiota bacterium]
MKHFTQLYQRLDRSTKTSDKLAALETFFRSAAPDDAAWGLFFLIGRRFPRVISPSELREWVSAATGLPPWLVEESYAAAGDLAETLSLLLPPASAPREWGLADLIEQRVRPLREAGPEQRRALVEQTWRELDGDERFLYHKLLTGGFRVGVSRALVERALAAVSGIDAAEIAHRLMGDWTPSAAFYQEILSQNQALESALRPYPFYLAYPLEEDISTLGAPSNWQAEWKWDGIRAQVIRREGRVAIWTRGEELVTDRYPEIESAARALPDGTVLDGELLAWRDDKPLPFGVMQQRIGRIRITSATLQQAPVAFVAYDVLERGGCDLRARPLLERRAALEEIITRALSPIRVSPRIPFESWSDLAARRAESRARGVEGVMLKRLDAPYGVGRERGAWWKWKIEPYTVDAVLLYAQAGHGRRAGLHTDYTLGVWSNGALVPVAKAYSGLTDAELNEVDRWIRRNTLEKHGPVRVVKPELVFEIAFEGIQASARHKSGVALRFPRIARWRRDKRPEDADQLDVLTALLHATRCV